MGRLAGLGLVAAATGCIGSSEPVDTDAPFVAIISPKADSTVSGVVVYSAQVIDGFGVKAVRFKVDGEVIFEDLSEPYTTNWATLGVGNGPHALRVEAEDLAGHSAFTSISVNVDNTRN
jgi:hypothetical protein